MRPFRWFHYPLALSFHKDINSQSWRVRVKLYENPRGVLLKSTGAENFWVPCCSFCRINSCELSSSTLVFVVDRIVEGVDRSSRCGTRGYRAHIRRNFAANQIESRVSTTPQRGSHAYAAACRQILDSKGRNSYVIRHFEYVNQRYRRLTNN